MWGLRHPLSRDLYEQDGEVGGAPVVRVVTGDGRTGRFRADGSWIDGARLEVDPHLCGWIAGRRALHRLGAQRE